MDELALAIEYLGVGAKTATGYGRMQIDTEISLDPEEMEAKGWLKSKLIQVKKDHKIPDDIGGYISKPMAEEWIKIEKPELKKKILKSLQQIWDKEGRSPSKKAQKLYDV
jgi:hypothetical protein